MDSSPDKNKLKHFILIKARLVLLAIIALFALAGCVLLSTPSAQPALTDTPASSGENNLQSGSACPASAFFLDGAEVFLSSGSRIAINKISDPTIGTSGDEVSLYHGEIVVNSLLPADKWVEVFSPNGFTARLSGRTMIVAYEGTGGQFTVACLDGVCKIGPDPQHLTDLGSNTQASLDKDGNFLGPFAISLEGLASSCETIFQTFKTPTPIPTETLVPTLPVDTAATATAACQQFHDQFPLTPTCP